jgi:hypothetical protein
MNYSEYLSDVLIIEQNGLKPTCFILDNLPKRFLFQRTKKLVPMQEYSERMVPEFTVDEHGKHIPTGTMEDTLQPGVELSQSGDGAYLFFPGYGESKNRLAMIDEYIKDHIADPEKRKRVPYAAQPGLRNSAPVARHQIPHVVLPASPKAVPPVSDSGTHVDINEGARQAKIDNLARAREAKKLKAQEQK